ncbi:MAG: hypothetical protein GWN01_01235 [Nitrosopumilaceae archaeon]|nr:hypothetical protein [Nitrosopumilaceae archaeon]NIU85983.1 hypothetical protein [Nitrosopumilaceae archaeon]NIX60202.1 hypothetical protein [Nitrosopumilaceae archaeon]
MGEKSACPQCGSNDVVAQKWKEAELEELPGVYVKQIMLLCKKCLWGWNCAGTLDTRKKESQESPDTSKSQN